MSFFERPTKKDVTVPNSGYARRRGSKTRRTGPQSSIVTTKWNKRTGGAYSSSNMCDKTFANFPI